MFPFAAVFFKAAFSNAKTGSRQAPIDESDVKCTEPPKTDSPENRFPQKGDSNKLCVRRRPIQSNCLPGSADVSQLRPQPSPRTNVGPHDSGAKNRRTPPACRPFRFPLPQSCGSRFQPILHPRRIAASPGAEAQSHLAESHHSSAGSNAETQCSAGPGP